MSDFDKSRNSAYGDCLSFLQLSDAQWAAILSDAGNANILPVQVTEVRTGEVPVPRFWWVILRTYWKGVKLKSKRMQKQLKGLRVSADQPIKTVVQSVALDPSERIAKAMAILSLSGDTGYSEEVVPPSGQHH